MAETFAEYGFDREDWIPIFELLDAQPGLEPRDASPAAVLKGDAVPASERRVIKRNEAVSEGSRERNSGGQFQYITDGGGFALEGEYGPVTRNREGLLVEGWFMDIDQRFQGEGMEDAYLAIINATQAPYLDQGLSDEDLAKRMEHGTLGTFDVPADYDRAALEDNVEAGIRRLQEFAALQETLDRTLEEYVGDRFADSRQY